MTQINATAVTGPMESRKRRCSVLGVFIGTLAMAPTGTWALSTTTTTQNSPARALMDCGTPQALDLGLGFAMESGRPGDSTAPGMSPCRGYEENSDFALRMGKAMDVPQNDYPEMLKQTSDFSIYTPDGISSISKFQQWNPLRRSSSLFDPLDTTPLNGVSASTEGDSTEQKSPSRKKVVLSKTDQEDLDRKNKYRLRFGLMSLSPEEFMEFKAQVEEIKEQHAANYQASLKMEAAAAAAAAAASKEPAKPNLMEKIRGLFESTCESHYDCEHPEFCCDLGVKKMCCSSGALSINEPLPEMRLSPVYAQYPEFPGGVPPPQAPPPDSPPFTY